MLDDVAARVPEELELLRSSRFVLGEHREEDIQVARSWPGVSRRIFLLFPDLDPPGQGKLQRLAIEVLPVAKGLQRVLVNLVARHHPEDKPRAVVA